MRLLLLIVAAALIALAWGTGLLSGLHPEAIRSLLREQGALGPVLFVVLFAAGEMIAVPSVLFVIAAGLAWPFGLAFTMAWVGSVVSALVVFAVSRWLARDLVRGRMPARLRTLDARLERGGILPVASLRLVAFLAPWTHPALALSSVTTRDYVIGTAIGVVPGVLGLVFFGEVLARWIDAVPGFVWVALVALVLVQVARSGARDRRDSETGQAGDGSDGRR